MKEYPGMKASKSVLGRCCVDMLSALETSGRELFPDMADGIEVGYSVLLLPMVYTFLLVLQGSL